MPLSTTRRRSSLLLAGLVGVALGCGRDACDVVLFTNVHQIHAARPIASFEKETGLRICATYPSFESKATGALSRLLSESGAPVADVFWSDDPVRPQALVRRDLVAPYPPPAAADLPGDFRDPGGMWTGVGAQARVLLVNTKLVPEAKRPTSIRDLGDRRFEGSVAIPNPRHGTTLVHLAVLAARLGDDPLHELLGSLDRNRVKIAETSWAVKELVVSGQAAVGLTNSDHAQEAVGSGAPVAIVVPDQEADGLGALVLPTAVFLLRDAPHPENARRFVDFLVSARGERELAADGAYLPLRADPAAGTDRGMPPLAGIRHTTIDPAAAESALERLKTWLDAFFP
jgi:iron(III) transport system substrate-binding protein